MYFELPEFESSSFNCVFYPIVIHLFIRQNYVDFSLLSKCFFFYLILALFKQIDQFKCLPLFDS